MEILLIVSLIPFVVSIPDPHIKKTDANGNLHVHLNVPELGPVEHLRLNKVTQPRTIARGSNRNRARTSVCPPGYKLKLGHIPWYGQLEGNIKNTGMQGCSDRCNMIEHCCSFEYSHSRNVCNLHRECQPTQDKHLDYRFCVKKKLHLEGILISGGDGYDGEVEVFSPKYQCKLRSDLPEEVQGHTSDGMTLCGGSSEPTNTLKTTCITFSTQRRRYGKWVTSHNLAEKRMYHTSWNNKKEGKIILMGGLDSGYTTETITEGKKGGVPGFRMKYDTKFACSIADHTTNTVIITGGESTLRTVSRYGTSGHLEDLPPLNQGRFWHGCGAYIDNSGNQVLLVAGGDGDPYDHDRRGFLSSTEKLSRSSFAWVMVNNLPRKMLGVRGFTLGNNLYMTGGTDVDKKSRDEIYQWTGRKWKEVAKMKTARYGHAVSTIKVDEIKDFCY